MNVHNQGSKDTVATVRAALGNSTKEGMIRSAASKAWRFDDNLCELRPPPRSATGVHWSLIRVFRN